MFRIKQTKHNMSKSEETDIQNNHQENNSKTWRKLTSEAVNEIEFLEMHDSTIIREYSWEKQTN